MITIPRWTVYPAIVVLLGAGVVLFPRGESDPYEGAAATRRADPDAPLSFEHEPVVVLGIDGLDPELLREAVERFPERTPNFRWLIEAGDGIQPLATSIPPQSPVAWSNFITGRDPGGHGIFDFIHRDKTTRGVLSPTTTSEEPFVLGLPGAWKLEIPGDSSSNRTGAPFWELLAENGVPADIWRIPANFPVEPADGLSFPGMMTPVLDGTYGGARLFTDDELSHAPNDHVIAVSVSQDDGGATARVIDGLDGPPHPFKEGASGRTVLRFYLDYEAGAVAIDTGSETLVVEEGEWSDFVRITFAMLPMHMLDMAGITRFYLRSLRPFELYCAPVNIDPTAPATPVSAPEDASAELAGAIGLYYTQGMAEDVGALKEAILDDGEFLDQVDLVYRERMRMLDHAVDVYLEGGEGGLLFFYFSTVDLTSHMMWRHADAEHPHHDAELAGTDSSRFSGRQGSAWRDVIIDVILKMDPALGKLRQRLGDDPTYVVMSDHGFAPYRRKFDLNAWLVEKGYLVLRAGQDEKRPKIDVFGVYATGGVDEDGDGEPDSERVLHTVVDWSQTQAYGMGFNGLYLNLAGREADREDTPEDESGIVAEDAKDELIRRLCRELEALVDPQTGQRVVLRCDVASDVYSAERRGEGPDIVVGYNSGYGNSDEATQGAIGLHVLEDNRGGTFNGSHLMAPEVVPGTLLSNRPVRAGEHGLEDLTVEVLGRYGVDGAEHGLEGHRVLD